MYCKLWWRYRRKGYHIITNLWRETFRYICLCYTVWVWSCCLLKWSRNILTLLFRNCPPWKVKINKRASLHTLSEHWNTIYNNIRARVCTRPKLAYKISSNICKYIDVFVHVYFTYLCSSNIIVNSRLRTSSMTRCKVLYTISTYRII